MDTQTIEELVDLKGKAAVVTGGGSGIGQAIAMALAGVGAAVMIAESNLDAAYQTVGEIRELGGYAEAMHADACSAEDARRVIQETFDAFGSLDILVNAAATFSFSAALPQIDDLWSRTISSHVKGVYYYSQVAARKMIESGRGGRIINIASMDAMQPAVRLPGAEVNQDSVARVTKALALEFGTYKISVNALAPGLVQAPLPVPTAAMQRGAGGYPGDVSSETAPFYAPERTKSDELSTIVLFLVSEAGKDITGNLVVVE